MKTLQAKEGYVFIKKDKTEVYGSLIYTPDNFDETLITQVSESNAEEIKKAIEAKIQEKMKKYENSTLQE